MSLRKNLTIVPSDTPEPNQVHERVSLFNEDGSPFSSSGGSAEVVKVYELQHAKTPGATWAENQVDSPWSIRPIGTNPAALRIDQTGIITHYVNPDWETDSVNGGGIALADFQTAYPKGGLFVIDYDWVRRFENAIPANVLVNNSLGFDFMGMNWVTGSDYIPVTAEGRPRSETNLLKASGQQFVQVGPWGDSRLGIACYGNSDVWLGTFAGTTAPFTSSISLVINFYPA